MAQMELALTIMGLPRLPSPLMSHKAEHRNSDEDGQDNIRGDDAHHRPHAYHVTGAAFCEGEKRM